MNPTPSSASPVKPILPGVPVPFPCRLWGPVTSGGRPLYGWYSANDHWYLSDKCTHFTEDMDTKLADLPAPATAGPATFPKADGDEPHTRSQADGNSPDFWKRELEHVEAMDVPPSAGTEQKERGDFLREAPGYPCWGWTFMGGGQWHRLTQRPTPASDICSHYLPDQPEKPTVIPTRGRWSAAVTSDTPRTDAHRNSIHTSDVTRNPFEVINGYTDFAKHLEADLNATSRALSESQCNLHRVWSPRAELHATQERLALTEKRLGEAQDEATAMERARWQNVSVDFNRALEERESLRAQLATSQARLVEVEKERDEATRIKDWANGLREMETSKLAVAESALARAKGQLDAVKAALNFDISGDASVETTARRLYSENVDLRAELVRVKALNDQKWHDACVGASTRTEQKVEMLPIYDYNHAAMNIGDRFRYLVGTPHEQTLAIESRNGQAWLVFEHGEPTPLADFWYAKTDEPKSRKLLA